MAKILDISDALHYEENPKLKITDELTVTVSNEAAVILEILPLVEDGRSGAGLVTASNKLFSPEDYEAWYDGVSRECESLELRMLPGLCARGTPVFVDTNISLETLKTLAPAGHVLVMLAEPAISVSRFFDRPDRDKQFLYRLILEEPDPDRAMENYRQGLMRINSRARYERFLDAGFPVLLRDERRSPEQTLALAEQLFGL